MHTGLPIPYTFSLLAFKGLRATISDTFKQINPQALDHSSNLQFSDMCPVPSDSTTEGHDIEMTHQQDMLEDSNALTTSSKSDKHLSSTSMVRLPIPTPICQQIAIEWVNSQTDAQICNDVSMGSKSPNCQEANKCARLVSDSKLSVISIAKLCNSKYVHDHMAPVIRGIRSDVFQSMCPKGTHERVERSSLSEEKVF